MVVDQAPSGGGEVGARAFEVEDFAGLLLRQIRRRKVPWARSAAWLVQPSRRYSQPLS